MTRNEIIHAYTSGRIGRREFLRRMAATGASLVAATAMADTLRAAPAQPASSRISAMQDDVYNDDFYDGEDEEVVELPDTGVGQPTEQGGMLKPISVAASAPAAAVAFRLRRMRKPES